MPVATMYQYLERKEDILYNIYKHFMGDIVTALTRCGASDLPARHGVEGDAVSWVPVDKLAEAGLPSVMAKIARHAMRHLA